MKVSPVFFAFALITAAFALTIDEYDVTMTDNEMVLSKPTIRTGMAKKEKKGVKKDIKDKKKGKKGKKDKKSKKGKKKSMKVKKGKKKSMKVEKGKKKSMKVKKAKKKTLRKLVIIKWKLIKGIKKALKLKKKLIWKYKIAKKSGKKIKAFKAKIALKICVVNLKALVYKLKLVKAYLKKFGY